MGIRRKHIIKALAVALTVVFSMTNVYGLSYAQALTPMPAPGQTVTLTPAFAPALIKGLCVDTSNPFKFNFIVDVGDEKIEGEEFNQETTRLIKYFLAALTIPEKDLWVNLSPFEKDRIVPESFGATDMGRDLLAQDYLLKQLTASLISPETAVGKAFWEKVYKKSYELYGTTQVPTDTFNKVWIVPGKARVYENGDRAFVVEAKLKVMMEEDYLALSRSKEASLGVSPQHLVKNQPLNTNDQIPTTHSLTSDIVSQVVIPELEREVNTGKSFAALRQVYYSFILATWFKQTLKESILNKKYSDQGKTDGIKLNRETSHVNRETQNKNSMQANDASRFTSPEDIYARYLEAYKKGVCNMIKVEHDPYTNKNVPRKYFSGGMNLNWSSSPLERSDNYSQVNAMVSSPNNLRNVAGLIDPLSQRASSLLMASNLVDESNITNYRDYKNYDDLLNIYKIRIQNVSGQDPLMQTLRSLARRNFEAKVPVKVLDAGCGLGMALVNLKYLYGKMIDAYGIDKKDTRWEDLGPKALEKIALEYGDQIEEFYNMMARQVNLYRGEEYDVTTAKIVDPDGKVIKMDLVTSFFVLQYLSDPLTAWLNLFHQLADQGTFVSQFLFLDDAESLANEKFYISLFEKMRDAGIDVTAESKDFLIDGQKSGQRILFVSAVRHGDQEIKLNIKPEKIRTLPIFMEKEKRSYEIKSVAYVPSGRDLVVVGPAARLTTSTTTDSSSLSSSSSPVDVKITTTNEGEADVSMVKMGPMEWGMFFQQENMKALGQGYLTVGEKPITASINNCLCVLFPEKKIGFHFTDQNYLVLGKNNKELYLEKLFNGLTGELAVVAANHVTKDGITLNDIKKVLPRSVEIPENEGQYRHMALYPDGRILVVDEEENGSEDDIREVFDKVENNRKLFRERKLGVPYKNMGSSTLGPLTHNDIVKFLYDQFDSSAYQKFEVFLEKKNEKSTPQGFHGREHTIEVRYLLNLVAKAFGYSKKDLLEFDVAAALHDHDVRQAYTVPSVERTLVQMRDNGELQDIVKELGLDMERVLILIQRTAYPFSKADQDLFNSMLSNIQAQDQGRLAEKAELLAFVDTAVTTIYLGVADAQKRIYGLYLEGRPQLSMAEEFNFLKRVREYSRFEEVMKVLPKWAGKNWEANYRYYQARALSNEKIRSSGMAKDARSKKITLFDGNFTYTYFPLSNSDRKVLIELRAQRHPGAQDANVKFYEKIRDPQTRADEDKILSLLTKQEQEAFGTLKFVIGNARDAMYQKYDALFDKGRVAAGDKISVQVKILRSNGSTTFYVRDEGDGISFDLMNGWLKGKFDSFGKEDKGLSGYHGFGVEETLNEIGYGTTIKYSTVYKGENWVFVQEGDRSRTLTKGNATVPGTEFEMTIPISSPLGKDDGASSSVGVAGKNEEQNIFDPAEQAEFYDSFRGQPFIQAGDDRIALSMTTEDSVLRAQVATKIKKIVPRNKVVLEVGAGQGHLLEALLDEGLWDITAIDISKKNVLSAQARVAAAVKGKVEQLKVKIQQGDAYDLAFEKNRFDVVIFNESVGGLQDMEKAFGEAARVLRRGGLIIVTTYNNDKERITQDTAETHYLSHSTQVIKDALAKSGFENIADEDIPSAKAQGALTFFTATKSASSNVGGISLDPKNFKLEREKAGEGVTFDATNFENIEIKGLTPVILSVTPVTNLQMLLGANEVEPAELSS